MPRKAIQHSWRNQHEHSGAKQKRSSTYDDLFFARRRGGIRPGPDFSRHGISSAAEVGSATLGRCDEMPCFTECFASPGVSEFCQNGICQKPVKNRSGDWVARAALLSNRSCLSEQVCDSKSRPFVRWQLLAGPRCHLLCLGLGCIQVKDAGPFHRR